LTVVGRVGRICFSRLLEDEDLLDGIKRRAEENNIRSGVIALIGTLKNVTMGFYKDKKYEYIPIQGPLEIASCIGNVSTNESGEVVVHAHVLVSNQKGEAFGGHLMKGSWVGATAELVIIEAGDVTLQRALDEKTNLNLLKLG